MADAYLAQCSLLYRPDGYTGDDLPIMDYQDIVTESLSWDPEVTMQRDAITGSSWIKQIARGNASIRMSVTVARSYDTREQAESAAYLAMRYLVDHPQGTLLYRYAYTGKPPVHTREDKWIATLDSIKPVPMTRETWFGIVHNYNNALLISRAAWSAVTHQLTLTKPLR